MNLKKYPFFILLFFPCILWAQQPGTLTPVQVAERNKPATVLIQATFRGSVTAAAPVFDHAALATLAKGIRKQLENQDRYTKDRFWNMYIMTLCADINKYMTQGDRMVRKELNTTMLGSGFIITEDGYVVTNAHVISENGNVTRQSFAQQAFREFVNNDAKEFERSMGRKLTDDETRALTDANSWYFAQTMHVGKIRKEYSVVMGVSGKDGKIVPKEIPATIITQGSAIPGKDVAILKLQEEHSYPTIRIGNDKDLRVGEQVYVLGYPAVATFHPLISDESATEATLTRGIVSAKKNMKGGWEVLQTDASITHGNSGGPVMNEQGEVIGLATFGSIDQQRQQEVQGMNFIVPSTIVKEYIEKAKVKPAMSDISLAYEKALDLFDDARYEKALTKFESVRKINPSFPFIDKMIADTRSRIDRGMDREPNHVLMYALIGGGVALLTLILFLLYRKRRS